MPGSSRLLALALSNKTADHHIVHVGFNGRAAPSCTRMVLHYTLCDGTLLNPDEFVVQQVHDVNVVVPQNSVKLTSVALTIRGVGVVAALVVCVSFSTGAILTAYAGV